MTDKIQPLGVCDCCLSEIESGDWYTSKGKPRLYCCRDCRNTGNSRAGSETRSEKVRQRIARGEWINPATLNPPDPANVSAGISRAKKAAALAGTWRNPALDEAAREKLSQPRKHGGNPVLHRAIEKMKPGAKVADLTPEEQAAHRAYRRELREARREEDNAYHRRYYRQKRAAMTPEEREAQRERWRKANRRRQQKPE